MKKHRFFQIVPALIGCVAISVAVGRCSPITPSFYKGGANGGGSLPGGSGARSLTYRTKVLDSPNYALTTGEQPSGNVIQLTSSLNAAQLSEFRTHGRTEIMLSAEAGFPDQGVGFFELTYAQTEINGTDLKNFTTDARFTSSGSLVLAVSPTVPAELATRVLSSLQSVTISFNSPVQPSNIASAPGAQSSSVSPGSSRVSAEAITGQTGQTGPTGGVTGQTGQTGASGHR